jgi:hypothetical protein
MYNLILVIMLLFSVNIFSQDLRCKFVKDINIDGKMNEKEWEEISAVKIDKIEVKGGYDKENLYLGIKSEEEEAIKEKAGFKEGIETILARKEKEGWEYFYIFINFEGKIYDVIKGIYKNKIEGKEEWDSKAKVKVSEYDDKGKGYILEVRIPLNSIGIDSEAGRKCAIAIKRKGEKIKESKEVLWKYLIFLPREMKYETLTEKEKNEIIAYGGWADLFYLAERGRDIRNMFENSSSYYDFIDQVGAKYGEEGRKFAQEMMARHSISWKKFYENTIDKIARERGIRFSRDYDRGLRMERG